MMKITLIFAAIFLFSCTDAGTLEHVDKGGHDQIEVFKYYYADGAYVFVARFKDQPNVLSTIWRQQVGKVSHIRGTVVYENDSIQVILKR